MTTVLKVAGTIALSASAALFVIAMATRLYHAVQAITSLL
jgi:hypothetical protein